MAEYNFWDDRTAEDNALNYCPILNDYCYDMNKCDECEANQEFAEHFQLSEMKSFERMRQEVKKCK